MNKFKRPLKTRSKNLNRFVIIFAILLLLTLGLAIGFNFNWQLFKVKKQAVDIISELSKTYQTNFDVVSSSGVIKGLVTKEQNKTTIEIYEPELLLGTKMVYNGQEVTVAYKGIEAKTSNNCVLNKFPISAIIDVENMVYKGEYDKWDVKDDILCVEGKYSNSNFKFKADLRKNKVISIYLEEGNITANY